MLCCQKLGAMPTSIIKVGRSTRMAATYLMKSASMLRRLIVFIVISLFGLVEVSCFSIADPGWRYVVPGMSLTGEGQSSYEFESSPGLIVRFNAGLFSLGLNTEVTIMNTGSQPVTLTNPAIELRDATGIVQDIYRARVSCRSSSTVEGQVRLVSPGETCVFHTTHYVSPLTYFLRKPNPALCEISVSVLGLTRSSETLPVLIRAVWIAYGEERRANWSCDQSVLSR